MGLSKPLVDDHSLFLLRDVKDDVIVFPEQLVKKIDHPCRGHLRRMRKALFFDDDLGSSQFIV